MDRLTMLQTEPNPRFGRRRSVSAPPLFIPAQPLMPLLSPSLTALTGSDGDDDTMADMAATSGDSGKVFDLDFVPLSLPASNYSDPSGPLFPALPGSFSRDDSFHFATLSDKADSGSDTGPKKKRQRKKTPAKLLSPEALATRRAQNIESAKRSRERKAQSYMMLQREVTALQNTTSSLMAENNTLRSQNAQLVETSQELAAKVAALLEENDVLKKQRATDLTIVTAPTTSAPTPATTDSFAAPTTSALASPLAPSSPRWPTAAPKSPAQRPAVTHRRGGSVPSLASPVSSTTSSPQQTRPNIPMSPSMPTLPTLPTLPTVPAQATLQDLLLQAQQLQATLAAVTQAAGAAVATTQGQAQATALAAAVPAGNGTRPASGPEVPVSASATTQPSATSTPATTTAATANAANLDLVARLLHSAQFASANQFMTPEDDLPRHVAQSALMHKVNEALMLREQQQQQQAQPTANALGINGVIGQGIGGLTVPVGLPVSGGLNLDLSGMGMGLGGGVGLGGLGGLGVNLGMAMNAGVGLDFVAAGGKFEDGFMVRGPALTTGPLGFDGESIYDQGYSFFGE